MDTKPAAVAPLLCVCFLCALLFLPQQALASTCAGSGSVPPSDADMVQKCWEFLVEWNKAELREARGHYLCDAEYGPRGGLYSNTPGDRCHTDVRRAWTHETSELKKAYQDCFDYISQNMNKFSQFLDEHQEASPAFDAMVREVESNFDLDSYRQTGKDDYIEKDISEYVPDSPERSRESVDSGLED